MDNEKLNVEEVMDKVVETGKESFGLVQRGLTFVAGGVTFFVTEQVGKKFVKPMIEKRRAKRQAPEDDGTVVDFTKENFETKEEAENK